MKNQYNFLKTIDTSTSASSSGSSDTKSPLVEAKALPTINANAAADSSTSVQQKPTQQVNTTSNRLHVKSSLSKLHNLVASKFSTTDHQQQRRVSSQQATNKQPVVSAAAAAPDKHLLRAKLTTSNDQAHQEASLMSPELLAKHYDEIDQIYDYIRGLAPLPLHLRKIKSIDFELERKKLLQQVAERQQQVQLASAAALAAASAQAQTATPTLQTTQPVTQKTKVRQRDAKVAAKEAPLREPRLQGPLPIKFTTTTCESRAPSIKRVESLNLGALKYLQNEQQQPKLVPKQQQQPEYLISSPQRGQLFRLPRAHSTSTLTTTTSARATGAVGSRPTVSKLPSSPEEEDDEKAAFAPFTATAEGSRTLPVARLSRVSLFDAQVPQLQVTTTTATTCNSLNRLAKRQQQQQKSSNANSRDLVMKSLTATAKDTRKASTSSSSSTSTCSSLPAAQRSVSRSEQSPSLKSSNSTSSTSNSSSDSDSTTTTATTTNTTSSSSSDSRNEQVASEEPAKQQQQQQVKQRQQVLRLERPSKSDKWAEKSHSDYENDTVSLSTSASSLSDLLANNSAQRDRLSSSTGKPKGVEQRAAPVAAEQEHIYEQIPAHKSATQLVTTSSRHSRPFNYPTAFAPNVGLTTTGYLSRTPANHRNQQQQVRQQMSSGGTYPLPLLALRPLDHRHRLSMSNLHLLPTAYSLNHHHHHQQQQQQRNLYPNSSEQQATAAAKLNRSQSSTKVNRAPRLTPAQLLAQIQMPRAVSKRRGQQQAEHIQQQQQQFVTWRSANSGTTPGAPPQVVANQTAADKLERAQAKRRSGRRLTAIGIESALECVRRAAAAPVAIEQVNLRTPKQQQQQQQKIRKDDSFRQLSYATQQQQHRKHHLSYFEPAHLMEVPLIDCDDEDGAQQVMLSSSPKVTVTGAKSKTQQSTTTKQQSLNSVSDLHSFSSSSSSSSAAGSGSMFDEQSGTTSCSSAASTSSATAAVNGGVKSATNNNGNFVSSSSFIKCYYGREKPSPVVAVKRQSKPEATKTTIEKPVAKSAPAKSSRRLSSEKLLNLIGVTTSTGSQASRQKRKPQVVVERPAPAPVQQQQVVRNSLVGEFLTAEGPLLVRDRRIAALRSDLVRHYQHPTVQVASLAIPASHQQVVTARQQQSTGGSAERRQQVSNGHSTNTTNSTSSYEAAIKNSRERRQTNVQSAHAHTTSAGGPELERTKRVQSGATKANAASASGKSSTSGSGGAAATAVVSSGTQLVRVPKLSKASHLLNRPLPKPPVASSTSAHNNSSSSTSGRRAAAVLAAAALAAAAKPQHQMRSVPNITAKQQVQRKVPTTNLDHLSNDLDEQVVRHHKPSVAHHHQLHHHHSTSKQLSPLAVAISNNNTHPSPTVTTCTSSGISSRTGTTGTHLNGSAGSSQRSSGNQRLSSSSGGDHHHQQQQQRKVKSFSELHKQRQQVAAAAAAALSSATTTGGHSSPDVELSSPLPPEVADNSDVDEDRKSRALTSNLRLFDERFSSAFVDQQLASSNDSLLESINLMARQERTGKMSNSNKMVLSAKR